MTPFIPFGHWAPDREGLNQSITIVAKGVRPSVAGFEPVGQLETASDAIIGVIGTATFLDADGNIIAFAGNATNLYKL